MDFGGGERSAFPISCSFSACLEESDLACTQNQISAISGGCFGHACCYIWALAPASKVTRELRIWNLISADDCTVGSGGSQQLWGAMLWEQHFKNQSRFRSLVRDVKYGSHSSLVAPSLWSVFHFSTGAAVEKCSGVCFDEWRLLSVNTDA